MKKRLFVVFIAVIFLNSMFSQDLIIYTEESPPGNFTSKFGNLTGSSVEMVEEIQKRIGNKNKITVVPWARGYGEIQEKDNVILFSMTRTEQREDLFRWLGPVLRQKWVFYSKKENPIEINSLEDAKNVNSIGTYRDDAREQFLISQGFNNIQSVNNNILNIRKLIHGRIDLFVSSNVSIYSVMQDAGYSVKDVKEVYVIKQVDLYIAFSKNIDDNVFKEWSNAFSDMKEDGTFQKIYSKWFPQDTPPVE